MNLMGLEIIISPFEETIFFTTLGPLLPAIKKQKTLKQYSLVKPYLAFES